MLSGEGESRLGEERESSQAAESWAKGQKGDRGQ